MHNFSAVGDTFWWLSPEGHCRYTWDSLLLLERGGTAVGLPGVSRASALITHGAISFVYIYFNVKILILRGVDDSNEYCSVGIISFRDFVTF